MLKLTLEQQAQVRDAVESACGRDDVAGVVENVYLMLQDAIDLRKPVCNTSGRCCKFDEFGHNLFVTTMELATFVRELRRRCQFTDTGFTAIKTCPYQSQNLCTVHSIRPFGCRIFFCDQTAQDWQKQQYERFHVELKRLHEALNVPYFYVEWRQALEAVQPLVVNAKSL